MRVWNDVEVWLDGRWVRIFSFERRETARLLQESYEYGFGTPSRVRVWRAR